MTHTSDEPALFSVLQRVAQQLGSPVPTVIVLGLDPFVLCTRRPVELDGTRIEEVTLFLSLPLSRLLSEAEMISLIAVEMVRSELVPPDWEEWVLSAYTRWAGSREGMDGRFVHFFNLLWYWMDAWTDWSTAVALGAAKRAAAISGRQNAAAGLAAVTIFHTRWPAYLAEVQIGLRRGSIAADGANLSEGFAQRIAELSDELSAPFRHSSQSEQDQGEAAVWMALMQGDLAEFGRRLATGPSDRASNWFAGLESLEAELSAQQIKRIFFVSEAT